MAGTGCLANIVLFSSQSGLLRYGCLIFFTLLILTCMIFSYVFPLLSRFRNSVMGTLRNAILLCIGYLPRSLVITAVNSSPGFCFF